MSSSPPRARRRRSPTCAISRPKDARTVAGEAAALAAEGLRVLGVACARMAAGSLPGEHSQLALEFLGLVGLADPLRATVPAAIPECQRPASGSS